MRTDACRSTRSVACSASRAIRVLVDGPVIGWCPSVGFSSKPDVTVNPAYARGRSDRAGMGREISPRLLEAIKCLPYDDRGRKAIRLSPRRKW